MPETKIVGHRWSARSSEVREFLARNQVPYRWYPAEEPEGQRLLTAAGADGLSLPVVITPDGDPLIEPTDAELAARVGLATTPSKDFYDLVVVGGGPAGLGAAVYGASEGLRTVLVEQLATGGQAGQSSRIENYLGFPDGVSGALDAQTVVLATGVSYRKLDVPGLVAGPDLSPAGERPPGWPLDRMPYHLETSVPGVFVAGDARAESAKRVASAVGEGAMAVMLVHRYLEKL